MLKSEIQVGETYYFVGSDSPVRKHLSGHPFTVVRKERVFRKQAYRRGRPAGTVKVLRFFNDDGLGVKAEELEPLPEGEFFKCVNADCGEWVRVEDLHVEPDHEDINSVCPFCGHTAQIFNSQKFVNACDGIEIMDNHDSSNPEIINKNRKGLCNNWGNNSGMIS